MKERPILFSAPMVRALLDGRKTQTRRLVKPQPEGDGVTHNNDRSIWFGWRLGLTDDGFRCPYGAVGDRLWVKETWAVDYVHDALPPREVRPTVAVSYAASWAGDLNGRRGKTRVSIHMPRWASRITLEVTDVRVERVQGITADDAVAEGACPPTDLLPVTCFKDLWSSINGADSWAANPWVWCVSFKRVEKAIGGGA